MTEETVRVWLVERSYGHDEDLVTLVYATPDGSSQQKTQLSYNMLYGKTITAAREVLREQLDPVRDEARREQFATEATRMAETHEPDDEV